jgi:hypothetical protein
MTSLPACIKVGKTPATQNLALEQYELLTFYDFKKMRIQKLLNRVEKYRCIFLWTTRHKGK